MKKLSLLDSIFLTLENRERLMHVASLLIFKKPESYLGDYFADLLQQFKAPAKYVHPFNKIVQIPTAKHKIPFWVEDKDFDIDYHVRHIALPSPGGLKELETLVSYLHSSMLDRSRPLWECHIIEGLEDNRFALYLKVHHACFDGIGRMKVLKDILKLTPELGNFRAPWQASLDEEPQEEPEPKQDFYLTDIFKSVADNLNTVQELGKLLLDVTDSIIKDFDKKPTFPFEAPPSIINKSTSGQRVFASLDLPLAKVKEIGKKHGSTINEVVMSVCAGALRKYLLEKNSLPADPLVAFVPISIRPDGNSQGNHVSSMVCNLATTEADPVQRLKIVTFSSQEGKKYLKKLSSHAAQALTFILQSPALALQLLRSSFLEKKPPANLLISNYPGPKERLYLNGALLESIYPMSFLFGGQGLNITLNSYADTLNFGIIACKKSIPDVKKLSEYILESFRELDQT